MRTVHILSIGNGRPNVTLCPDGETPREAFERIKSNIEYFGGTVTGVCSTYPLGSAPIDASTITFTDLRADRDVVAPMWHMVTVASDDEWAPKP